MKNSLLLLLTLVSINTFSQKNKSESNIEIVALQENDANNIKEDIFGRFEKITEINKTSLSKGKANTNQKNNSENSHIIYLSVLRYNNEIIDICPISRNYDGEWNFDDIHHKFEKGKLSSEDALTLVSKFSWEINEDFISRKFSYDIDKIEFPQFLSRKTEVMRLK